MGKSAGMSHMSDIAVLQVDGDLDVSSVPRTQALLDELIGEGCHRVILNMANVGYADSSGLGLILAATRRIRSTGGLLSLTNVQPRVYRALCMVRVLDFVPVSLQGSKTYVPELDPSTDPILTTTMLVKAQSLSEVRARITAILDNTSLTHDEVFDMTLAVGEAMGNAIDHSGTDACVLVTAQTFPDRVVFEVTDCGEGFELAPGENPPAIGPGADRGRGIRLMRLLADAVSISRRESGCGTVVKLVKMFDLR